MFSLNLPIILRRKILSFLRQPLFIQFWFVPLWFMLGVSKFLIFTIQFQTLAKLLGQPIGINPWLPLLDSCQARRALLIGRAVRLAGKYTPWESNCFPQAIAARCLLGLYGIPFMLYFGLQRDPESSEIKAHAWVAAGKVRVTGGLGFDRFTVVGCFVSYHHII